MAERNWLDATPSKTAFVFGLILGVGGMSLLALGAVIALLVSGEGLNLKFADNNGNGVNSAAGPSPEPFYPEPTPTGPVEVAITDQDHIRGNKNADVTLVEFSDFQCPFCGRFAPTVARALEEYQGKIRLVYKHFPLESIHPQARPAAEASECASEQGKFWEFHDALFENQDALSNEYYGELAKTLKLDVNQFTSCLTSGKYRSVVDAHYQQGIQAGVQGTPHTLVNGIGVSGAVPYETLKAQIDAALAQ